MDRLWTLGMAWVDFVSGFVEVLTFGLYMPSWSVSYAFAWARWKANKAKEANNV